MPHHQLEHCRLCHRLTLIDLNAAFDTNDHTILLHRLFVSHHNASRTLDWFVSNLRYKTQCVSGTVISQDHLRPYNMEHRKALSSVQRSFSCIHPTLLIELLSLVYSCGVTRMTPSFVFHCSKSFCCRP